MTLTDFLLARIADDEAVAKAVADEIRAELARDIYLPGQGPDPDDRGMYRASDGNDSPAVVIGPVRVLAECEAKRRIVEDCRDLLGGMDDRARMFAHDSGDEGPGLAYDTLRALALPYADHPDYDPSWEMP